ncbi:LacI family DNA-binding transcriptional regulator [Bifidobacterium simiarum]|uniref:LacI family DNA-binding transcriptional regulator n=1 Tax=Bifidobacterium simiarum TaxID=2045441 RepID=UPI001F0A16E8|nr:LacI family DNA-binding transcriptional regulator [Bifidobacterium simiarum]
MMARTTIGDVAKAAGVSVSTVSRALRGLDKVNPDTRKRVEDAAGRLHFSFSKSASSLASGKTMRVAVLLPNQISGWFTSHAFEGVYEVLSQEGYDVIPYVMWEQRDLDAFFQNLPGNQNVDAVVVVSFALTEAQTKVLEGLTVPVLGLNTPGDEGFAATARVDDIASMQAPVRLLHSLGHRSLAYVEQPEVSPFLSTSDLRTQGFEEAAKALGYGDEDILIVPAVGHTGMRSEQDEFSGIAAQLMSAPSAPTGVCVENDKVASALVKELRRLGVDVPAEMSVIGFDDDYRAALMDLTTVHQNPLETGRLIGRKALTLMRGEPLDEPYKVIPTSLVLRGTTNVPPQD